MNLPANRVRIVVSVTFLLLTAAVLTVTLRSASRSSNAERRALPTVRAHAIPSGIPTTEAARQRTNDTIPDSLRALPLATETHVANPNLFVVAFLEDLGLALGSDGAIFRSTDAGQHWTDAQTSTDQPLTALSIGHLAAIAVGMKGTILVSTDRGQHFIAKDSGTNHELRAITRLPKSERIVVVGDKGVIVTSVDDGQHWTLEDSPTQSFLGHVVADPRSGHVIVAGEHGTVLVSAVEGKWQTVSTGIDAVITALEVRSDGIVLAATEAGPVLRSRDGGLNWSATVVSDTQGVFVTGFASDPQGRITVASTRGGHVCRTLDAAETWSCRTVEDARYLNLVAYVSRFKSFVAVGDEGGIWTTELNAETWTRAKSPTNVTLEAVADVPRFGSLVAVGHGGGILRSEDGGHTWNELRSAVEHYANAIAVGPSGKTIIAVGTNGKLSRSTDAGKSYSLVRVPVEDTVTFFTVAFHPNSRAWLAGGNGNTLLRSSDDGRRWQSAKGLKRNVGRLHVHSDGTLLALTIDEGVLRSTDGGQSWIATDVPDGIGLTDAQTLESNKLIAVGRRGAIYDSVDGGQHFTARSSGSDADLAHIAEDRRTHALWVVGTRGTLLTSADRGEHWRTVPSGTEESLNRVLFASPTGPIIVVGNHGTVLVARGIDGNFQRIPVDTTEHLRSIERESQSQQLVAVGKSGIVLVSKDGIQWQRAFSHTLSRFSSIATSDDGLILAGDRLVRWGMPR